MVQRGPVEAERLQLAVRLHQHGTGRSLVHAARLDADEPVLDEIDAADAVLPGDPVEPLDEPDTVEALAVERHRRPLLESDGHLGARSGRVRRVARQHEQIRGRLEPRVLQRATLVADVPQVPIAAV